MESQVVVTCPFFKEHKVRVSRFHNHFHKCKLRHTGKPIGICRYGCLTCGEYEELREHEENCRWRPDTTPPKMHGNLKVPRYVETPHSSDEDWDSEPDIRERILT
ncbi:gametocyte-specific factor 1-like, partial [Anneissia japonica]|uniref:gametocyte-specific factor 1-like n=1 Tax=Anneissia japonica TaxID=1529436 RepID=UPI0014256B5F